MDDLNLFIGEVAVASQLPEGQVQASREIIEHYNPGTLMAGFEKVGYFMLNGVRVFEKGKVDTSKDCLTMEQVNFPKGRADVAIGNQQKL